MNETVKDPGRRFNGLTLAGMREALRISREELAELAGLSRMTLARIESGTRPPKEQEWGALLRALDTLNRRRQREFVDLMARAGRRIPGGWE